MHWKLEQYRDSRGGHPVEEFIEQLPLEAQAEVAAGIRYLQEVGNQTREPFSKSLGNGLFELRIKAQRIFFCFRPGRTILFLHACSKQTRKTPLRELRTSKRRLKEVRGAQ